MALSYFTENDNGNQQLWVTDGTVAGTRIVKALNATTPISQLTMIGSRVYFTVDDGVHGQELWTSDGTTAGTTVLDINPGPANSFPFQLTSAGGTLFFDADDGTHGNELWTANGTTATLVKDIVPGAASSVYSAPFANVNGTVFFVATDGTNGLELWKSDGTAAGTVMVKDIFQGAASSTPLDLTNVNGKLFFYATDGISGYELWTSDGTAAGTHQVKDINPGPGGSILQIQPPVNINGTLFFEASDGTNGQELWKSDGTAAGTVMVKDINPGGVDANPLMLTNVNGTLFFFANDGAHGYELWKSDGTAAGTVMVKDINPGIGNSFVSVVPMVNVNGTLFFGATDGGNGVELWKSDGTAAGTVMVKDINPGAGDSNPFALANVNGVLEFYAFDGTTEGLFRSDGTAAGTIELATNVSATTLIGYAAPPVGNDLNGDAHSDILWRKNDGTLAAWSMNGGSIQSSGIITSGGAAATPGPSWNVAGISDFNGDGIADVLWRNSDGTLVDWTMNGTTVMSSGVLNLGGVAVKPDATWSVIGTGDFDDDTHADILWRKSDGTVAEWGMNGANIVSSGLVTSGGAAVNLGASWSVAGVGDFNGDNRRDVLWRNTDGTLVEWNMNGSAIQSFGVVGSAGLPIKPDASWSVAGIGDFNADGNSDILWRRTDGSLAEWLMNGSTVAGSGTLTGGGIAVAPDATWQVVEIGDFNGDGHSDILWRNTSGAMAEWLMNGTTIVQSVVPNLGGTASSPDATWSTQAKPTNFG